MNEEVQLLVFQLEGHFYGVRLAHVERVVHAVELTPLPGAPEVVSGIINHRGSLLPVLNLRKRFGLPTRELGIDDQFVIASAAKRRVALAVDHVRGMVSRPERELLEAEKSLDPTGQIEGAIQLGDDLILIHELDRSLSTDEIRQLDDALSREAHDGK